MFGYLFRKLSFIVGYVFSSVVISDVCRLYKICALHKKSEPVKRITKSFSLLQYKEHLIDYFIFIVKYKCGEPLNTTVFE